jgi:hypothetical protein
MSSIQSLITTQEVTMAYVARPADFHPAQPYRAAPSVTPRKGFWRTLVDAVADARRRDAQRDVERYLARRGRLTDSIERELAERAMRGDWS